DAGWRDRLLVDEDGLYVCRSDLCRVACSGDQNDATLHRPGKGSLDPKGRESRGGVADVEEPVAASFSFQYAEQHLRNGDLRREGGVCRAAETFRYLKLYALRVQCAARRPGERSAVAAQLH